MKRVVIVGGGTGGTMLANMLDRHCFDVTVISASALHLFQPALLYIAFKNASADIGRQERRLLPRHVHFVQEAVSRVDLAQQVVTTGSGTDYLYDAVVLATGVMTDPNQIEGMKEVNAIFGDYHSSVSQAQKVWSALNSFQGGTIALGTATPICKCPPSPIEGILLIDELLRKRKLRDASRLIFFTPYPRAYPAIPMNEIVEPVLKERGIGVMPFFDLDRIDVAEKTIYSIEGDTIRYDLPVIIPPFVGADIRYSPPDVVDADRFIKIDKANLRVVGFDSAFAIGDGASLPTSKAGVGAHLQAKVVAAQLSGKRAEFDGRTHCPLDLGRGLGTFVIGSYTAPVIKYHPDRVKHLMKAMMGRMYWLSLRGLLEPLFDLYFRFTRPRGSQT